MAGGCINSGAILTTSSGKTLFLKTNQHSPPDMFAREAEGLRALSVENGPRLPEVYLFGERFLLLEDLSPAERSALREEADRLWSTFVERARAQVSATPFGGMMGTIGQAIDDGRDLRIRYWSPSRSAPEWRTVTPIELRWAADRVYLLADCHLRGAERTFRVDRILVCAEVEAEAEGALDDGEV